jgi:hypothetical protein
VSKDTGFAEDTDADVNADVDEDDLLLVDQQQTHDSRQRARDNTPTTVSSVFVVVFRRLLLASARYVGRISH